MRVPDSRAQWFLRSGPHETYHVLRGKLFYSYRGSWQRVLSFCLDDPEQGPVVALPIVYPLTNGAHAVG